MAEFKPIYQIIRIESNRKGVGVDVSLVKQLVRCRECRWVHICRIGQHLGLDGFCSKGEMEPPKEEKHGN